MTPQEIKTTLRNALLSLYGSVVSFSAQSGVHRNTVSTALSDRRDPRLSTISRIADKLNMSLRAGGADGIDGTVLSVPDALNLRRKQLDMTLEDLSTKSEVSLTAVSALSANRGDPQLSTLCKVAEALGMTIQPSITI